MDAKTVITAVIATAVLIISLPILVTALVAAAALTGVSTNFTSALKVNNPRNQKIFLRHKRVISY